MKGLVGARVVSAAFSTWMNLFYGSLEINGAEPQPAAFSLLLASNPIHVTCHQ